MKYTFFILAAVVVAVAALAGCAKAGTDGSNEPVSADLETYKGLSAALTGGDAPALFDVRTAEEYASGHIPGAVNIPYDVIGSEIPIEDKDASIVVYCRSGNRSGQAKKTLESLGFTNVINFGGVSKWEGNLVTGSSPE